jgi:hypothetical protein
MNYHSVISHIVLTLMFLLVVVGCQGKPAPGTAGHTASRPAEEAVLLAPRAAAPVIDGRIEPGEWASAAMESFADGSELLLMSDDNTLYLAIRSATPEMIAANVFLNRGEQIEILHVSAALGTALYKKGALNWQQQKDFTWCCRQVTESEAAAAERVAFLADDHWLAVNSRVGTPNELEYQIELNEGTVHLAISILRSSSPEQKTPWPADLDDDTIKPTPGGLPAELDFRPAEWATVALE